jgi:hypothetical protein
MSLGIGELGISGWNEVKISAAARQFAGRACSLRSDAIGSQAELRCSAIRKTSHPSEERPSFVRVKRMGHPSRRFVIVARSGLDAWL